MKYNIEKSVLTTDTGELIKHLNCPINKRWENLVPLATTHLKRRCNECHKNVIDISVFSDEQVVRFNFAENKANQRKLIKALLHCSKHSIEDLATILNISLEQLIKVQKGAIFLQDKDAEELGRLFLLLFSD